MSPSSHWTLFIARPGRDRQHVIRDPQGEPRIIFGEDDGTRINDRLARYLVESLNASVDVEDPNPNEGWFLDSLEESNEQDPAILICDPDFEIRLEILDTGSLEEDQALGRKIVALINTYFNQNAASHPSASSVDSAPERQQTGSKRWTMDHVEAPLHGHALASIADFLSKCLFAEIWAQQRPAKISCTV
jgi:hypothetical protein